MNKIYTLLLANGTTGTVTDDSIEYQNPESFIGEPVTVKTTDENGTPIEVEGFLEEVLEVKNAY